MAEAVTQDAPAYSITTDVVEHPDHYRLVKVNVRPPLLAEVAEYVGDFVREAVREPGVGRRRVQVLGSVVGGVNSTLFQCTSRKITGYGVNGEPRSALSSDRANKGGRGWNLKVV